MVAVTTQLTEMSIDPKKHFDFETVGAAMLGALSNELIPNILTTTLPDAAPYLQLPVSELTSCVLIPAGLGQPLDADLIAGQIIGQAAGNYVGTELGNAINTGLTKANDYLIAKRQSIQYRQTLFSNPNVTERDMERMRVQKEPSHLNKEKAKKWQSQQAQQKDWGRALDPYEEQLMEEMNYELLDSFNPQIKLGPEPNKHNKEITLANNPNFKKRNVGLDGRTYYSDRQGAIYFDTPQGVRRIFDPPVESFHLLEDIFLMGGAGRAAVEGLTSVAGPVLKAGIQMLGTEKIFSTAKSFASKGYFKRIFGTPVPIDSRKIAAQHIKDARNLLKKLHLTPSQRNQILHSFDLETFRLENVMETRYEYRLFDDHLAKLQGRYVSPNFLENQTERIVKFALPKNSATRTGIVKIPEGSIVFRGNVAPQIDSSPGLIGGET